MEDLAGLPEEEKRKAEIAEAKLAQAKGEQLPGGVPRTAQAQGENLPRGIPYYFI